MPDSAETDPAAWEYDHRAVHRAAWRRARRIQRLDMTLWLAAAGLGVAAVSAAIPGYAAAGGAVVAVALLWRGTACRDTATMRELAARRAAFTASCTHSGPGSVPDPHADADIARLCADLDAAEIALPWWQRTA